MTAPNAALAYKVLDLATANPDRLDMEQWSSGLVDLTDLTSEVDQGCGTTACYAGWTAAHAGYKVHERGEVYRADGGIVSEDIEQFAARLLGITGQQADYLFYVADDDLSGAVAEIFGPRPAVTS